MSSSNERTGNITVKTSDIFPIIKKWLYSEHDIFIRELIANATDAITKRHRLSTGKNLEIPQGQIKVEVDPTNKELRIIDNGVGMTETEVEKYIAQLAFSGAEEFVSKMKEMGTDASADIIGKFGLGFYSAFMVAENVTVETLSMNEGAMPCKWYCEGSTEYKFLPSSKNDVGTTITLKIADDSKEFLESYKITSTLRNFCSFLPYKIEVVDCKKIEDATKDKKDIPAPTIINEKLPLWKKNPNDIKDEEYLEFFRSMYPMEQDPLFWIHLKVDHPFTLEGILYFPKINLMKPFKESNISLYCKQVFVSDNVKNIIPDFLNLLKGVIDSTDIPLNVSRSSLQGDPNVKKISNYVVKKVAESLKKLFSTNREKYETIWNDIGIFVKYGCVSDTKFDEMMREMVIYKNSDEKYMTAKEYQDSIPESYKEKLKNKIIYFEIDKSDNALRKELQKEAVQVVDTNEHIDPHFMQHIEIHKKGELEVKFVSIDSEFANLMSQTVSPDDLKAKDFFEEVLLKGRSEEEKISGIDAVEVQNLKDPSSPAYLKVDEQMKRFQNMAKTMGQESSFPLKKTLVLNAANGLIKNALQLSQKENTKDVAKKLVVYIEDLAKISSEGLKTQERELFVKRGQELMEILTRAQL